MSVPRWEPPITAAIPHQGEPGREYGVTDARGSTRTIRADANGIVWPTDAEDVRLIDAIGLPVSTDWWAPDFDAASTATALSIKTTEPDLQEQE